MYRLFWGHRFSMVQLCSVPLTFLFHLEVQATGQDGTGTIAAQELFQYLAEALEAQ